MKRFFSLALLSLLVVSGCWNKDDDNEWEKLPKDEQSLFFLNEFAYNMMSTYYLWNNEIKDGLSSWAYNTDPIAKVRSVRYKDAEGATSTSGHR